MKLCTSKWAGGKAKHMCGNGMRVLASPRDASHDSLHVTLFM